VKRVSLFYLLTVGVEVVYFRLITLRHTPQSVGLLWTRDRPVAETSAWQHKHCTRLKKSMRSVGFELTIPASVRPQTHALDRAATGIGESRVLLYTYTCSHRILILHGILKKKLINPTLATWPSSHKKKKTSERVNTQNTETQKYARNFLLQAWKEAVSSVKTFYIYIYIYIYRYIYVHYGRYMIYTFNILYLFPYFIYILSSYTLCIQGFYLV
jgi:hypothetical protein